MTMCNIASIVQSSKKLSEERFKAYLSYLQIKFKSKELDCLKDLYSKIHTVPNLNNFFIGYEIPQIGKEFDLLRIGTDILINIELKSESTEQEIYDQLKNNRYYLSFIDNKEIHTYAYDSSKQQLYYLDDESTLQNSEFEELCDLLLDQSLIDTVDLDALFKPNNYLVSPFNSTDKFIDDQYFLTQNQVRIKDDILTMFNTTSYKVVSITGEAGTGKTLLTYDIAKSLMKDYKVAIIHCANLNEGHYDLKKEGWSIFPIRDIDQVLQDDQYDVIVLDEAQRVYSYQLDELYEYVKLNNVKCIFSYDGKQCFSDSEFARKNPQKIEGELKAEKFKLTKKIRTNKEISNFVNNLFTPRLSKLGGDYKSVEIQYLTELGKVKSYTRDLKSKGWEIINYTTSRIYKVSYDNYQHSVNLNAHNVIGQEFDKVVAVIDSNFYINPMGMLDSYRVDGAPNYDLDKMLYQITTRARERLMIVVLNNPTVFDKCLKVINFG
ncbi:DNA/RNA helicase domain-containing protein [Bacillus cereus group sp. BfR-BA-01523]|uniref:DNA/RNA helicase domain-containing protein n=1 Tax=Bacillus cereus group sp. BfR-BA-01523 TaxID=2920371 RepID=UPI001F596BB7|nr:DNA/RNA helicase domain-containing protein [Bacillus cereus group sp. BfR-BA-01523]